VEVAHEAMLQNWSRLREWLEAARESLRVHRQLAAAAADWANAGKEQSFLATGNRLLRFQALASDTNLHGLTLNKEEGEFLRASVALREREEMQARKRKLLARGGVLAALIILGLLAIVAIGQAREATALHSVALSREIAAKAMAEVNGNTMRSLLLGLEASKIAHTEEAAKAVREALVALHPRKELYNNPEGAGNGPDMEFSHDGKKVVIDNRVLNVSTGDLMVQLQPYTDGFIRNLELSPDDRLIAGVGSSPGRVWDALTGAVLHDLQGHEGLSTALAFSPDGKLLATGGNDATARIWNPGTGHQIAQLRGHTGQVNSVLFSPDVKLLLTASDDRTARIWSVSTGAGLSVLKGHTDNVRSAEFSPDGRWALTASSDGTARLWDSESGRMVMELSGHDDSLFSARFSNDGKWITTASNDGTVKLWDTSAIGRGVTSQEELVPKFTLESNPAMDARFSADDRWLVTTNYIPQRQQPWVARIWEVTTGKLVAQLGGRVIGDGAGNYSAPYAPARLSPDLKWLLVADGVKHIDIYEWELYMPAEHLLTIAHRYTNRQLTCEERQLYLHEQLACDPTASAPER
jgi:hypothetical protein